ncbi:MAG: ABC transporter ATP-binding protein [Pseudomonadota bacterium]
MAGAAAALVTSLAAVSYGFLVKALGDRLQLAVEGGALGQWVWVLPGLIVLAALIRAMSLYAMTLANNTGIQRALVSVSNAQFSALIKGDYARLSGRSSGDYTSRFLNDINVLRDVSLRVANNLPKNVLSVTGAFLAMLVMDWQLALVLLATYPIAIWPVASLGQRIRKRAKQAQAQAGDVTAFLTESFQSARATKAYGLEGYQTTRADAAFLERARLFLNVLKDRAGVDPILEVAGGVALAGVLAFSAWRIADGATTLGDFLGFIALIGIAAPEMRSLGSLSAAAQEGRAAADRFFAILDAPNAVADGDGPSEPGDVMGALGFEDVTFGYGHVPALRDIRFSVAPGETVAIVGPSGAGKSTLFNLILRLYDPLDGTVTLDGRDVRDYRLADLRGAVALVEQDPVLFDDTIAANIALGRPGASDMEIVAAAEAAHAAAFIDSLPEKYETRVGERGGKLSGGQRQRVALARAILRGAPILLLDEATSALDTETEQAVGAAIQHFAEGRTVLVIAHRLSTVQWADRVIVLEGGRVVEEGSHAELEGRGGTYARLVKAGLG